MKLKKVAGTTGLCVLLFLAGVCGKERIEIPAKLSDISCWGNTKGSDLPFNDQGSFAIDFINCYYLSCLKSTISKKRFYCSRMGSNNV